MQSQTCEADRAVILLDEDQAIILFELLSERVLTAEMHERSAEIAVLNVMLGQLEKQLLAPFSEDYAGQLSAARNRLVSNAED